MRSHRLGAKLWIQLFRHRPGGTTPAPRPSKTAPLPFCIIRWPEVACLKVRGVTVSTRNYSRGVLRGGAITTAGVVTGLCLWIVLEAPSRRSLVRPPSPAAIPPHLNAPDEQPKNGAAHLRLPHRFRPQAYRGGDPPDEAASR